MAEPRPFQEIFDVIVEHLLTQKETSRGGGECLYRGPNGLKCAVGVLIPDDMYDAEMEGCNIDEIRSWGVLPGVSANTVDLLEELQELHDMTPPENWESALRRFARRNFLKFNPPKYD